MTKQTSRRAVPRGSVQPYRAGLSPKRTEIARSGSRMTESRLDAYGYNDRNELTNAVKNAALNEYAYQYDDQPVFGDNDFGPRTSDFQF